MDLSFKYLGRHLVLAFAWRKLRDSIVEEAHAIVILDFLCTDTDKNAKSLESIIPLKRENATIMFRLK
jgi:hypothetical protein